MKVACTVREGAGYIVNPPISCVASYERYIPQVGRVSFQASDNGTGNRDGIRKIKVRETSELIDKAGCLF